MYRQETIKPYNSKEKKEKLVEAMFDNIASTYDALNHRLSWNIDKYWRSRAIKQIRQFGPKQILDVATGTGDFALRAAQVLKPDAILAVDISERMMAVGRQKVAEKGLENIISFKREDCTNMTFEDESFDAVITAFGIRNFESLDQGLKEMHRVLSPGGHLSIIELSEPLGFPMHYLFKIYAHTILPLYGKLISKDKSAYTYLTATIEAFPQGEEMVRILHKAGFSKVDFKRLTCGICTMYLATK